MGLPRRGGGRRLATCRGRPGGGPHPKGRNVSGGAGPEGPACGTPGRAQKGAPLTRTSEGRPRNNAAARTRAATTSRSARSEEHTSELQSLMRISYAALCLKKKKTTPKTYKPQSLTPIAS